MTKRWMFILVLLLAIPGLLFVASCAKKTIKSDPGTTMTGGEAGSQADDRAKQQALEEQRLQEERLRQEAKERRALAEKTAFEEEHIFFEYDKSRLIPEAKTTLKRKARWMLANPGVAIVIEGHCDERGTSEYNMALGDRRAQAAKNYLIDLGIQSSLVTTISYGEERPIDLSQNEAAWAKNRRAQFVLR